jgi:undecaprenyl-diphosphatase
MEWFEAVILGLVQGLTEFLPVSSSGHLEIGKVLLGVEATDDLMFTTMVHAATVLSTLVVFRKQIWDLLKGFFKFKYNDETDYVLKIAVSIIPIMIVGLFFKDQVEALFGSIKVVGMALVLTSVLLFFSDLASKPGKGMKHASGARGAMARNGISYWQAFVVGLSQSLAVIPGLSRSGTTISTGLICGVRRDVMAQFSFLMVLIPILGESFLELAGGEFSSSSVGSLPLALGFVSAFVSGLFACKVMIALVKKARLSWFAVYCLIAAAAIFIFA